MLAGVTNFRDFGGYPVGGGRSVRTGFCFAAVPPSRLLFLSRGADYVSFTPVPKRILQRVSH